MGADQDCGDPVGPCKEESYLTLHCDTTEAYSLRNDRTDEKEKCIGSYEFWNEVEHDGAQTSFLGEGVERVVIV